jgi:hypothetical protein
MMLAVFWTLFVVGLGVGASFGWSAGWVRGVHVGHDQGAAAARDFDDRWRAQAKQWAAEHPAELQ